VQTNTHFWSYLTHFFVEWKMFQTKVVEEIKTHILCLFIYLENRAVYEIMLNNIAELGRPHVIFDACAFCAGYLRLNTHNTLTHTHSHTLTHTLSHTHSHTHSHTRTHTYILTHSHSQTICSTYCFSTATMVARTWLIVAFIRTLHILLQRRNSQYCFKENVWEMSRTLD